MLSRSAQDSGNEARNQPPTDTPAFPVRPKIYTTPCYFALEGLSLVEILFTTGICTGCKIPLTCSLLLVLRSSCIIYSISPVGNQAVPCTPFRCTFYKHMHSTFEGRNRPRCNRHPCFSCASQNTTPCYFAFHPLEAKPSPAHHSVMTMSVCRI